MWLVSSLNCLVSFLLCGIASIMCLLSCVLCLVLYILCLLSFVLCLVSCVSWYLSCVLSFVWCVLWFFCLPHSLLCLISYHFEGGWWMPRRDALYDIPSAKNFHTPEEDRRHIRQDTQDKTPEEERTRCVVRRATIERHTQLHPHITWNSFNLEPKAALSWRVRQKYHECVVF